MIGAGHNGLVAANLLADAGWSVEVLEAENEPGGAVRHDRGADPEFASDLFSAFCPLAAASPVLRGLHLEREGLSWSHAPKVLAHPRSTAAAPSSAVTWKRRPRVRRRSLPVTGPRGGAAERLGDAAARGHRRAVHAFPSSPRRRPAGAAAARGRRAPTGQDDGAAGATTGPGGVPRRGRQTPALVRVVPTASDAARTAGKSWWGQGSLSGWPAEPAVRHRGVTAADRSGLKKCPCQVAAAAMRGRHCPFGNG